MLGKLTRWLRMLGYDVEYFRNLKDSQLLERAKKDNRVLLTKDRNLYCKAMKEGVECKLVNGRTEIDKLSELAAAYNITLKIDTKYSRCTKCNQILTTIPKDEAEERLMPGTLMLYKNFWICQNCNKIYWKGSHWKGITQTINQARKINIQPDLAK